MTASDLHDRTLSDLAELIRTTALSPVELTTHLLARIDTHDPYLRAYDTLLRERALVQAHVAADEIAHGHYRGPLHGIPLAVKSLLDVAGVDTTAGMPWRNGNLATEDSTVVRRLSDAGAVVLGTLRMTEGAYFEHHPDVIAPINPWNPDLWSGASSSGPGVAVAAGLSVGTIGTDTGGSIRFPSAANNLTGLKPTYGRVSRHGAFPAADSLDHVGPLARTTLDTALVLHTIAGPDPRDPSTLGIRATDVLDGFDAGIVGIRIGVDLDYNQADVDTDTVRTLREATETLAALGAVITDAHMPPTGPVTRAWALFCSTEAAISHAATFPARRPAYGSLAEFLDLGADVRGTDLVLAGRDRAAFGRELAASFDHVDLLLVPTQPRAEITIATKDAMLADPDRLAEFVRFATPFDMTGNPTLTLPGGQTAAGTPVSFQLVARRQDEALLIRAGHAFQEATAWHERRPGQRR